MKEDIDYTTVYLKGYEDAEEKLIKYLEKELAEINDILKNEHTERIRVYLTDKKHFCQDILQRVKSGKYD